MDNEKTNEVQPGGNSPCLTKSGNKSSGREIQKLLAMMHANNEVIVHINKSHFLNGEVALSPNLQVRAIRPESTALHLLLIDDQIVTLGGRLMNSVPDLMEEIRKVDKIAELVIIRQANRQPATRARLSAALCLNVKNFSAPPGYQYFVVTLKKIPGAHLGMKVQQFRDKVTVTEVNTHSIAFYNYMVGDNIIDINLTRITDIASFREMVKSSLKRYNTCTTLVERPDSQQTLYRSRVIVQALSQTRGEIDPTMAGDVVEIGQREARRYAATVNKSRSLHSALLPLSSAKPARAKSNHPSRRRQENDGAQHRKSRKLRKEANEKTEDTGNEEQPQRRGIEARRRRSSVTTGHIEDNIQTDAANPYFLQKVPKHKPPASSLTFFTKIWKGN